MTKHTRLLALRTIFTHVPLDDIIRTLAELSDEATVHTEGHAAKRHDNNARALTLFRSRLSSVLPPSLRPPPIGSCSPLAALVKEIPLTQTEIASLMRISQPKLSKIIHDLLPITETEHALLRLIHDRTAGGKDNYV